MMTRLLATRRRPTTATTVADTANVNDDEATSGGRRRPTTARSAAKATSVHNDESTNGRRCRSTADVNDNKVKSGG